MTLAAGGPYISLNNDDKVYIGTGSGGATALTLDTSQNATFAGNVKITKGIKYSYYSGWIQSGTSGVNFNLSDYSGANHFFGQIHIFEYPSANGAIWNCNNHSTANVQTVVGNSTASTGSAITEKIFEFYMLGSGDDTNMSPASGKVAIGIQQNGGTPKIYIKNNYGNTRLIMMTFINFST
jgi:hypothetical protein